MGIFQEKISVKGLVFAAVMALLLVGCLGYPVLAWGETATSNASGSNVPAATETVSSAAGATHSVSELSWYPEDPKNFKDFHNQGLSRVVDLADLLTTEEEQALSAQILEMSERTGYDFVLLTDISSYGESRGVYAADYYQFNGYGYGEDYSGVIYFVCMESGNRGFWTAARGSARGLLTEENVNAMDDATYDLFKSGNYGKAIQTQFDNLDVLYSTGHLPKDWTLLKGALLLLVIVAVISGIVSLVSAVRKMKTVLPQAFAREYVCQGPEYSVHTDKLVDHHVSRHKHAESSGGGGGGHSSYSGGYSSSGGGSFSGGGRSF